MPPWPRSTRQQSAQVTRARAGLAALLVLALGSALPALRQLSRDAGEIALAAPAAADPVIEAVLDGVDIERALEDARRLSGEVPLCLGEDCATLHNRVTGSTDLERAVDWLIEESEDLGYAVSVAGWQGQNRSGRHVFARREGLITPTAEIWYVAHVDGVAGCPEGRCPAADDNASGAVAGLELLRALADHPSAYTLVVMFTTGEEQNVLGVESWLETVPQAELDRIRALINADMIGWDGDGDRVMELYHGDEAPSIRLAEAMSATLALYTPMLRPRINPGCG